MLPEQKPSPEEISLTEISKPFDPTDAERIAELNAKFEGKKSEQETQEKVERIKQEENEVEIHGFASNLKQAAEAVQSRARIMLDALYERQQERFTPLQSEDGFRALVSSLKKIQFSGKVDEATLEAFGSSVQKVTNILRDVEIRRTEQLKENAENLEKLGYGAKSFSGAIEDAGGFLAKELSNEALEAKRLSIRKDIHELSQEAERVSTLAFRLRENI